MRENDQALDVVKVIVEAIAQAAPAEDLPGGALAHLNRHGFRARGDILVLQEIGRAASPAEHIALRQRARLGRIGIELCLALAERSCPFRTVHRIGPIQSPLIAQEVRDGSLADLIRGWEEMARNNGAMVVFLTEIMPVKVRTSGFSLAYSLATGLFGGFTPAVATYLIYLTGNRAMPGVWLSFAALLGLTATLLLHRRGAGNV